MQVGALLEDDLVVLRPEPALIGQAFVAEEFVEVRIQTEIIRKDSDLVLAQRLNDQAVVFEYVAGDMRIICRCWAAVG